MKFTKIDIKPLSVNKAWKGKRFKTNEYRKYEKNLILLLPKQKIGDGYLSLDVEFGFSSMASDLDNPLKPFIDVIQKKYGFNDKQIFKLFVTKTLVKKGKEFIQFKIKEL